MTPDPRPHTVGRHEVAVQRSLSLADRSAASDNLADAIAWVDMVEAVDGHIPDEYTRRRSAWRRTLTAARQARAATYNVSPSG